MPLTPEDVDNKRFATARVMRQGYDMTEVDNFLDEVAAEMKRLYSEIDELKAAASSGTTSQAAPATEEQPAPGEAEERADDAGETSSQDEGAEGSSDEAESSTTDGPTDGPTDASSGAAAVPADDEQPTVDDVPSGDTEVARVSGSRGETLRVTTTEEAAAAAARMLELAGRNAEELVSDARSQADTIVSEASSRAEQLDGETEERRRQLVADLERDHQELKDEVEDLRAFEREYRAQLRHYFQQQLEALDAQGGGVTLAEDLHEDEGEIGSRLRSILAEEESTESSGPDGGDTGEAGRHSSAGAAPEDDTPGQRPTD